MSSVESFKQHSINSARDFLQTVVVLDDELGFSPRGETSEEDDRELEEPDTNLWGEQYNDVNTTPSKLIRHPLDYNTLSLKFAQKGLVCCGLKPQKSENSVNTINNVFSAIEKSDLCILDWEMNGKKGDITKKIISTLAKNDFANGGKLRFITIYTGVPEGDWDDLIISSINTELLTVLSSQKEYKTNIKKPYLDILKHGESTFWRVYLISKKDTSEENLPDRLVEEFSSLTSGLLSNATLATITEVRNQTSKILAKYNNELDPAYISHILGLMSLPGSREHAHEVAFDYAVNLISEEIKSQLQISKVVKESLNKKYVAAWPNFYLEGKTEKEYILNVKGTPIKCNSSTLSKMLTATSDNEFIETLKEVKFPDKIECKVNLLAKKISDIGGGDIEKISNALREHDACGKSDAIDKILAKNAISISLKKNDYSSNLKLCSNESTRRNFRHAINESGISLKLGTILKNNDNYYICIQPLCDSVRLSSISSFIFLKAVASKNNYNYVIETPTTQHEKNYAKIKISLESNRVVNMNFDFDPEKKMVIGKKVNNSLIFNTDCYHKGNDGESRQLNLEWIGELKEAAAQKIVNQITAQISRVGLDEFEWLRVRNLS